MVVTLPPLVGHRRLYAATLIEAQRHHQPYRQSLIVEGKRIELAAPNYLSIEAYGNEYITYHWTSSGEVQSHVHTDTLDDAFQRCADQFGLLPDDWVKY